MSGLAAVPASVVITDAITEIRVARAGDVLAPETMAFGLSHLSRLMDRLCVDPRASVAVGFPNFTPIPNHQPHTLGPGGDWVIAQAPVVIRGANLIWTAVNPVVRIPLRIRDAQWWSQNQVRGVATAVPTDLYYSRGGPGEATWPLGSVYLWPVPTMTYPIELELDTLWGNLKLTDNFWLPYGYSDLITLWLAVKCAPGLGQAVSADLRTDFASAQEIIFGRNSKAPNQVTRDAGMPTTDTYKGRFNFLSGFAE